MYKYKAGQAHPIFSLGGIWFLNSGTAANKKKEIKPQQITQKAEQVTIIIIIKVHAKMKNAIKT